MKEIILRKVIPMNEHLRNRNDSFISESDGIDKFLLLNYGSSIKLITSTSCGEYNMFVLVIYVIIKESESEWVYS